jgi:hypothetical protein
MRICLVTALATLALWWLRAWAAEDIDPDACFCLRHPSGQSQRGCRAEKFPGQFYATAVCRDAESKESTEILMTPTWTVVMEGEEGCEVCRSAERETADVPRGEDEDQEKAAE